MNSLLKKSETSEFTCQIQYEGSDAHLNFVDDDMVIDSASLYYPVNIPIDHINKIDIKLDYNTRIENVVIYTIIIVVAIFGIQELFVDGTFVILVSVSIVYIFIWMMNELIYPYRLMFVVNYQDIKYIWIKKKNMEYILNLIQSKRIRSIPSSSISSFINDKISGLPK